MKYRKFLTRAILTSAICLLTVLAFTTEKAEAWGWYGVNSICLYDLFRGQEGKLKIQIVDVTVRTQCYNINGEPQYGQPGEGNLGIFEEFDIPTEPLGSGKLKGIVTVDGCFSLDAFNHPIDNNVPLWPGDEGYGDHPHTCWPSGNENKIEQDGSAWIYSFKAKWWLYDLNGNEKNSGTDECKWDLGTFDELGYPNRCIPFTCKEKSVKKINSVKNKVVIPPDCQEVEN